MSDNTEFAAQMLLSLIVARDVMLAETAHLLAAIQTHHDTKHGRAGGRSAAVLVAVDRALYEAAGVKHAVLGFAEGALDEVRRAPARVVSDVGFVEDAQMLAFEAVIAADSDTLRALDDVRRAPAPVDDGCCHKTRLADAPCPIGRECPFITKETTNV